MRKLWLSLFTIFAISLYANDGGISILQNYADENLKAILSIVNQLREN